MSDAMLWGVLRMPPNLWRDTALDVAQRYSRYIQAADTIEELRAEVAALRGFAQEMQDIDGEGLVYEAMIKYGLLDESGGPTKLLGGE